MSKALFDHIVIEKRKIGFGKKVFIMAEIGVNHNGDKNLAKSLVDAAQMAGADCVKFQTFRTEEFMADKNLEYNYSVSGKMVKEKMYDMFKRLELPLEWHKELFDYAREKGVIPLTSVADPISTDMVEKIGVGGFKLSSEDLINLPLVEHVVKKNRPIIFSTGMANTEEVMDVMKILKKYKHKKYMFLHCISVYPTPIAEVNLRKMLSLQEIVHSPVGYSDHTVGIEAALAAVAMGACVIEKHFTLDRNMEGPDHSLSSDPDELKMLVKGIRQVELMMGAGKIEPSVTEKVMMKDFRRSVVAIKDLSKGHVIKREDLVLKRPGQGLRAREIPKILNRKLKRTIKQDEIITLKHLV